MVPAYAPYLAMYPVMHVYLLGTSHVHMYIHVYVHGHSRGTAYMYMCIHVYVHGLYCACVNVFLMFRVQGLGGQDSGSRLGALGFRF